MWFSRRLTRKELEERVLDLGGQVNELTIKLFQSEQFERIADAKLKEWVTKHDELLIRYKQLKNTYEPVNRA